MQIPVQLVGVSAQAGAARGSRGGIDVAVGGPEKMTCGTPKANELNVVPAPP